MPMRLSAVMPAFDQRPDWLCAAVGSVARQVDRLVIVDDGSSHDTSAALARESEAHGCELLVRAENSGSPAAPINDGVSHIGDDADWLTWVSTDNEYREGWASALKAEAADDVGAVYGGFVWQRVGSRGVYMFTPHTRGRLIAGTACYYGPAFIIRADVWREAGEHRGIVAHDYDHWLRVEEVCTARGLRIVGVDRDLATYRAHADRMTERRRSDMDADRWQAEARARRLR